MRWQSATHEDTGKPLASLACFMLKNWTRQESHQFVEPGKEGILARKLSLLEI